MGEYKEKRRRDENNSNARKGGDKTAADLVSGNKLEHEPVQAQPLQIIVRNGQFDRALRAFRALVQKERILSTYKEKQSYEKPSVKRRRKHNEMKRKRQELDFPREDREERRTKPRQPPQQ